MELSGRYVPAGRWLAVRFAITLVTSGELVKLRILAPVTAQDYFFYLYLLYVGLQVCGRDPGAG